MIVLRFRKGFSLRETAAILGKVIQSRAIAKLRNGFESVLLPKIRECSKTLII